jgi:hypothetical protein
VHRRQTHAVPAVRDPPEEDGEVDVARGIRQALVMVCLSAVVALAVAGVWSALQDGGFLSKLGIVLLVIAALIGLTGGNDFSRAETNEARTFLGMGPEVGLPDSGPGLTTLGAFLLVSLPLGIVGLVLAGFA